MNMAISERALKKETGRAFGAARDDVWPSRAELRMAD
jgi:hypothetical protein